jgi:retron-type reverse transcriptase
MGRKRPIGIPAFEDKVAQRAVSVVLEAIYEQDFLPCSYGFRPGRSAHQALNSLRYEIWSKCHVIRQTTSLASPPPDVEVWLPISEGRT